MYVVQALFQKMSRYIVQNGSARLSRVLCLSYTDIEL